VHGLNEALLYDSTLWVYQRKGSALSATSQAVMKKVTWTCTDIHTTSAVLVNYN